LRHLRGVQAAAFKQEFYDWLHQIVSFAKKYCKSISNSPADDLQIATIRRDPKNKNPPGFRRVWL
jgi:hypothetical protein